MVDIKLDKVAYDRIMRTIEKIVDNTKDMEKIWDKFADYYPKEIIDKAFETRGSIFGEKWKKYNPEYLKWKQKAYPGKQMLVLSGQMRQDATVNIRKDVRRDNLSLIIENDLINIHQKGSKSRNIPARSIAYNKKEQLPTRAIVWLLETMERNYKDIIKEAE